MIPKDCKRLAEVDFPIAEVSRHAALVMGAAVVRFRVNVLGPQQVGTKSRPESATQSIDPVGRLLAVLQRGELSAGELRSALRIKHRPTFRANYLHPALDAGLIEYTIPDKPNSRLQKYRLTEKGRKSLGNARGKDA